MESLQSQRSDGALYFHQKLNFEIGPRALAELLHGDEPLQIVDVRACDDFRRGHLPGAVNLPFERQQGIEYIYHLNKMTPVIVYSYNELCTLDAQAAYLLARNGYRVQQLLGGWEGWLRYNLPVEELSSDVRKQA